MLRLEAIAIALFYFAATFLFGRFIKSKKVRWGFYITIASLPLLLFALLAYLLRDFHGMQ